jgi:hypothetical protein
MHVCVRMFAYVGMYTYLSLSFVNVCLFLCAGTNKAFLFRCEACPDAYCEDHLPAQQSVIGKVMYQCLYLCMCACMYVNT